MIPENYKKLNSWRDPQHLRIAFEYYGLKEIHGHNHSPVILEMADYIGDKAGIDYTADEIPWCGVFAAYCLKRAGWDIPDIAVRAKQFLNFGSVQNVPMRGDVMVFDRHGGGHVAFYVSEDAHTYHCIGGNQSDAVNIRAFAKDRLLGARRPRWKMMQPLGVRQVFMKAKVNKSVRET